VVKPAAQLAKDRAENIWVRSGRVSEIAKFSGSNIYGHVVLNLSIYSVTVFVGRNNNFIYTAGRVR